MVFGIDQPVGRPKGALNHDTKQFKQAINNLLEYAAPQMVEWLNTIAQDNPSKALDHIQGFAEFIYPKLSRAENTNTNTSILQLVLGAEKIVEANRLAASGAVVDVTPTALPVVDAVKIE